MKDQHKPLSLRDQVNDIHRVLVGDEMSGHVGLVKRVDTLEKARETDRGLRKWAIGAIFGAGVVSGTKAAWIKALAIKVGLM